MKERLRDFARSRTIGYTAAVLAPIAVTRLVTSLGLPSFLFEHLILLLVVGIAIRLGLGPAVAGAIAAVVAGRLMLIEPIDQPPISGLREAIDLALFGAVAIVVSGLVAKAHAERVAAERAAERERRAREDRDRLIATVTHDLATPLSVLSGSVQFARRAGMKIESDLPRLLARLETASARATSLVRTLADAQALETEGLGLSLTNIDLRALVSPLVEMMDRVSERHPVILAVPEIPVTVRGDADRLQRVVENLLNNAIKYSPAGGAVEVSVDVENGEAVLRVRDYGIGISAEARPRIFERSYRAPEASAQSAGLGLGLSIAAKVVARHGGTIQAEPGEGCGTVMSVRLPLTSPAAAGSMHGDSRRQEVRA